MTTPTGAPESQALSAPGARDPRRILDGLATLEHVRGGLVVAPDGLVIASSMPGGIAVEAISALAAALGRELELQGQRLRRGTFVLAHFTAAEGSLFIGGTPVGFIVLLADPEANRDRVRQALRSAVEAVRRAWAR